MKIRVCLAVWLMILGLGGVAGAAASMTTDDLREVLEGSGAFGASVESAFELDDVVEARRLGKQYGALSGGWTGPYLVKAKPREAKSDYTVMLRIATDVDFVDADGVRLPDEGLGAPEGSHIKEVVTGWSVLPIAAVGNGEKAVGNLPDLGASEAEAVRQSKAVYQDVMGAELAMETMTFEYGNEPGGGSIKRWRDGRGRVRRVQFSHGGEHAGMTHDVFYDLRGRPRFLINSLASWGFVPGKPDTTRDKIRERRFYISESGLTVQVLEKYYEGEGEEAIRAAAEKAKNIVLKPDAYATRKFVVYAREMRDARKRKFVALSSEMELASEKLLEPAPSVDEKHWTAVAIRVPLRLPANDRIGDGVLGYLMRVGLVAEANVQREGNYTVVPEVVRTDTDDDGSMKVWVVVTALGLADDAIEGQRYLARLEGPGRGPLVLKYLGRQVKNWEGRGVQGWR